MSIAFKLQRKSPLFRKLILLSLQIPKFVSLLDSHPEQYSVHSPVLANSFPKSGTHLLLQILMALPQKEYFGSFLASTPSLTLRERSPEKHLRLLNQIIPGEVLPSHLFFDERYHTLLQERHCIHYFIYRDLRDVALSDAFYLTYMNRWHKMHSYFANRLDNDNDRIMTAITGISDPGLGFLYPDIAQRFFRYEGWLSRPDVFAIKFEDLSGINRLATLREIATFYNQRTSSAHEPDELVNRMLHSIAPSKSHTFRDGKIGKWKSLFTPQHKEAMKSIAGDLLIRLGYATDLSW